MLEYWIWLAHTTLVPVREKLRLLQLQGPEEIWRAKGGPQEALANARKILNDCRRLHIQVVTFADKAYPARLKNIADPPIVLYCKGNLPDFESKPAIGIVGTRKASTYGLQSARRLGYQIGKGGALVVTGMASGVDAMAAFGAQVAGQCVVGVLGCGVDVVYPRSNKELFRKTEETGCLISEYAPGTPGIRYHFPRRNRIISGLSNGVLVVEAPEGSGALITARRAMEQGRDVFVVPGNIDQPSCAGSNQLLKQGTTLAVSGWDVLREYQSRYPGKLHRVEEVPASLLQELPEAPVPEKPPITIPNGVRMLKEMSILMEECEKKAIDKNPVTAYSDVNALAQSLEGTEKAIVQALAQGPVLLDDLAAAIGLPAGKLLPSLTKLEIRGVVKRLPGKRICLK